MWVCIAGPRPDNGKIRTRGGEQVSSVKCFSINWRRICFNSEIISTFRAIVFESDKTVVTPSEPRVNVYPEKFF